MATTDEQMETAVQGLLQPEPAEEPEQIEGETAEEPETTEADDADDAAETEAEAEEDDASEEDDEAEPDDEGDEAQQTITVKVDGQDVTVTLDDLKRAYSGQAYIQRGMQEAAAKRKEAEQLFNALQAEQQRFFQTVQNVRQQGLMDQPKAPDLDLLDKDPVAYTKAKARYDQQMQAYTAQRQQLAQAQQRNAQMQQMAQAQYLQQQAEVLRERIPEFGDAEKAAEVTNKLRQVGREAYGFNDDELNAVMDARAVQVLHDAMRWRELQSGTAKAKSQPKPPKNVKPAARRPKTSADARREQRLRAKKTGNLHDWAEVLLAGGDD